VRSIRAQLSPPEGSAESCGNAAALTWLGSESVAAKRSGCCSVSGRSLSGASTKSLHYPTDQCEWLTVGLPRKKCGSRFSLPIRRSTRHHLPGMIEPRSFLLDALRLFAHLDFGVVAAIGSDWEVLVEGTNLTKKSAVHGRDPPQSTGSGYARKPSTRCTEPSKNPTPSPISSRH
jgi:hypothetical protein